MNQFVLPVALGAVALSVACSSQEPPRAPEPAVKSAQLTSAPPPAVAQPSNDAPEVLAIERGIREACGITQSETLFAYNSTTVDQTSQGLLAKIAECFSTGPLAGKTLLLVGHTDPRGDEEYNYALGGRRAARVQERLEQQGLDASRTAASSRGESDARGIDEEGWRNDRRVDLILGS